MRNVVRGVGYIALFAFHLPTHAAPADPLTATVQTADAERFARLFVRTKGQPTATQLQKEYLDPGSEGIRIFTPGRIENAATLARYVSANSAKYQRAIDKCLPVMKQANGELRAIYLALRGLYPTRALPQIYAVFGGGNSGGTAQPGAQVLGLEVLCEMDSEPARVRQQLRMMFAHETTHTWQVDGKDTDTNVLLRSVLMEGAADYIASIVLGRAPNAEREAFAPPREAELWAALMRDVEATRTLTWSAVGKDKAAQAAVARWVNNYGSAPKGWPHELGYWMGMRIWQRYVDAAPDTHAATETVLTFTDPEAVLRQGRFDR